MIYRVLYFVISLKFNTAKFWFINKVMGLGNEYWNLKVGDPNKSNIEWCAKFGVVFKGLLASFMYQYVHPHEELAFILSFTFLLINQSFIPWIKILKSPNSKLLKWWKEGIMLLYQPEHVLHATRKV